MTAYYNEHDPQKAAWLRELIADGLITPGDVDERSISDVRADDLRGYSRVHLFAGIGAWDYALQLAGWGDEPVWTGSCPCPSFSAAGKGEGFDDARHLWPEMARLIRECRPPVLFGEQVSAAIGHGWLDLVQADLEAENYAVGKAVLGACSVGAPHIRQRLYFVADTGSAACERHSGTIHGAQGTQDERCHYGYQQRVRESSGRSSPGPLAITDKGRRRRRASDAERSDIDRPARGRDEGDGIAGGSGAVCELADATSGGCGIERDAPQPGSCGYVDGDERPGELGISEGTGLPLRNGRDVQRGADGRTCAGFEQASAAGGLAYADGGQSCDGHVQRGGQHGLIAPHGGTGELGYANSAGREAWHVERIGAESGSGEFTESGSPNMPRPTNGYWRDADWIFCRDQRWRPVESTTQRVVDGSSADLGFVCNPGGGDAGFISPLMQKAKARVMRLRGAGDAINVYAAAAFIAAYMAATGRATCAADQWMGLTPIHCQEPSEVA